MSKKSAKSKCQKKVLEIVDQQKDPMLRSLQKKVRNINKKLTQISQLETKKDLKPQQEQKVSKKTQINQQKLKYLEMIQIYKEIAAENEKIIRKAQLVQLDDLAAALAIKEYSGDLGSNFNQNIENLVTLLTSLTTKDITLQDRFKEISAALNEYANNFKLKKTIKDYVALNESKKKPNFQGISNKPEPISPQSQQQRDQQLKQLEQDQKLEAQHKQIQPLTPTVVLTTHAQPIGPQIQSQTSQCVQKSQQEPKVLQQQNILKNISNTAKNQKFTVLSISNKVFANQKPQRKQTQREFRGYGGYRGRKDRDDQRNYEDRKFNKKPSFKPKYKEKQLKEKNRQSSLSSRSGQEPQERKFIQEELRQLIQDGFIVVGKPKIKAKDQKDQYEHQHGHKNHRQHTKKNY